MKRIEIHLTEEETETLDQIASDDGRSRKNLCETEIRKLIERWQKNKATENVSTEN
jgi:predicted transcriptional regulator